MAETPIQNDVFRFLAMRPPKKAERGTRDRATITDERKVEETPVGKAVAGAGQNASVETVVPLMERLVAQYGWRADLQDADDNLRRLAAAGRMLEDYARRPGDAEFPGKELERALKDILGGGPPAAKPRGGNPAAMRAALWDRLYAFYILNRHEPVNLEALTGALRALDVAEHLNGGDRFDSVEELRALLAKPVVLPALIVRLAPGKAEASGRAVEREERDAGERGRMAELWNRYVELNRAAEELQHVRPALSQASREAGDRKAAASDANEKPLALLTTEFKREARLPGATLDALSASARSAVAAEGVRTGGAGIPAALQRVHRELSVVSEALFAIDDPRLSEAMPREAQALPAAMALKTRNTYEAPLTKNLAPSAFPYPWVLKPAIRPLGIGDLKVVKQKLERYVAGEVAHIENVLDGESKERRHRRFDRSEDTITVARETNEETERDTQTTDRFELKKESERTIQTDLSVEAGVTVSASYGPVELGAHANFAYSQSTTDTTRTASNFARDVVDRSVTRIQKRTREERVTRTIHEVEEVNTHGLDNTDGSGHMTGVYRWVDKHYQAQLYNYGKRLMFEFVVPEPAAFFIYSQSNNPAKAVNVEKPKPLGSVTHKSITEWNYQSYIRDYNVQGVTPPPPTYHVLALALEQSGMQEKQTSSKASRELVVPDGYVASWWAASGSTQHWNPYSFAYKVGTAGSDLSDEDLVVPVVIKTYNVAAYAIAIEVYCTRTDRAYEQWQITTFEKIMAAYQAAMAAYEDKLRAAEARRGVVIAGQNPAINREIERNELKKHSVTMLTGERFQLFNAMSGTPPEIDLVDAAGEGRFVQFFEQAFEWEQMTYLFYPYFWGRKSNWVSTSTRFDNDPMFTRFLQAGYARVVVPVHPAYNDAILYYLQTGHLWNGGDAPVLDDPLYIALYQELKDQQDDLGNAVPEGSPWKVVLPTTLVWLQPGRELPDFTAP